MKEVQGYLWNYKADWYCVTTNGSLTSNGLAVMGAGVAKQARDRYPDLPYRVGKILVGYKGISLRPPLLAFNKQDTGYDRNLVIFPTKMEWTDEFSSLDLIQESAFVLKYLATRRFDEVFALTRPGCGNGNLRWVEDVKPIIQHILPDNVHIVHLRKGNY